MSIDIMRKSTEATAMKPSTWTRVSAAAVIAMLPATGFAQVATVPLPVGPAKQVSPSLPGDDKLTCQQVFTEYHARLKDFDALHAKLEAATAETGQSARTLGLFAASQAVATATLASPDVNPAASAAIIASSRAHQESFRADIDKVAKPIEDEIAFNTARSEYLSTRYRTTCKSKRGAGGATAAAPTTIAPASSSAIAMAPSVSAAATPVAQPGGSTAAHCAALKAESERLHAQMAAGVSAITQIAQSQGAAKSPANAGRMAASVATALIPGLAGVIDAVSSTAATAAQQAQQQMFDSKVDALAQQQGSISVKMAQIDFEHEEKCSS
jgi:hypothetical protein